MIKPSKRIYKTMTEYVTKALLEAVKTYLRNWLLVVVPTVITLMLAGIDTTTGDIMINWYLIRAVVLAESLGFISVGLDRYKHVYTKSLNPKKLEGQSAGILKF